VGVNMPTMQLNLMFVWLWINFINTAIARTPQQCYYDANKPAADDILPCYPSTFSSHYTCCKAGDKCLEDKACYDLDTGNTYQYGCTDSTFTDPHCPQKCELDTEKSHWIGLVYCNGTHNLPNNTWLCHHPDNCGNKGNCANRIWSDGLEKMPPTGCEDLKHGDDYVAFNAAATLSDTAVLPVPSKTSAWWAENADRYRATSPTLTTQVFTADASVLRISSVSSTSSVASGSTASASATSTAAPDPYPTATHPSPDEKQNHIGMGVGIGVGVPLTLCIAVLGLIFTRRRRKRRETQTETQTSINTSTSAEKSAAAAYGHRSELDGTPIIETYGSPGLSEMQGSSVEGTPWQSPVMAQGEFGGKKRMSGGEGVGVCELAG
jgi:hypothetical protein